jgi:hypothetical protein
MKALHTLYTHNVCGNLELRVRLKLMGEKKKKSKYIKNG